MTSITDIQKQLIVFALCCWAATFAISVFYPLDRPVDEVTDLSFAFAFAWVAAQAFLPIAVVLLISMPLVSLLPRLGGRLGKFLLSCVPVILLSDCVAFHWIGERFLSSTMLHILWSLLPGLLPFVGAGTIAAVIGVVVGILLLALLGSYVSRWGARRWSTENSGDISPVRASGLLVVGAALMATPALWRSADTFREMRDHSVRHPLCAFRIAGYRSVGVAPPRGDEAIESRLQGMALAKVVNERVEQFSSIQLTKESAEAAKSDPPSDVLIVIIESLQLSLLNEEVMPNAFSYAQRGLTLRQHFSGGNASNLGIFSLLNGMEATWFPQSQRFLPVMNTIFHQAGYELGFYGGTDDWADFGMLGFVNGDLYDQFMIEPVDWLDSDRRSVENAAAFLNRDDEQGSSQKPRLAVVYLYSSHSPYKTLPDQEVFQPAAREGFVAPYPMSARAPVWNRYRNSVRSMDHLLKPLLRDDRVMVIVGDHGEAFLEDGTLGHGTRLSQIQNMTPAMIYAPNREAKVIEEPTFHGDLLPTLLDVLGLDLQSDRFFQGTNLWAGDSELLRERVFAACHYLMPEMMLIGSWTKDESEPFGFRNSFSTDQWQVSALNPIDPVGLQWEPEVDDGTYEKQAVLLSDWLVRRFGFDPTDETRGRVELFRLYLNDANVNVRLQTLDLIECVERPSRELFSLLRDATFDESAKVRPRAREVLLLLQRRRGAL